MRATFVFDTSALVYYPHLLEDKEFEKSDLIIPIVVLEELDKLKTFPSDAGKNARIFIRLLDKLTENCDINKGIKLNMINLLNEYFFFIEGSIPIEIKVENFISMMNFCILKNLTY